MYLYVDPKNDNKYKIIKRYFINYAGGRKKYFSKQNQNMMLAQKKLKFDHYLKYNFDSIDDDFKTKNKKIFHEHKGNGYWLWKPYIILKTLEKIDYGDLIFYTDVDIHILKDIDEIVGMLPDTKYGMFAFQMAKVLSVRNWTKRDCLILMDMDDEKYYDKIQMMAGVQLMIKNDFTINFCKEWLEYAEDHRIISDDKSELGEEFSSFKEHRHDQSIFSLLVYKHGIDIIPEITVNGSRKTRFDRESYHDDHGIKDGVILKISR